MKMCRESCVKFYDGNKKMCFNVLKYEQLQKTYIIHFKIIAKT